MKKPALFLTVLFLSIILSTVMVSTIISSVCKSFYKENTESVKSTPANNPANGDIKQASVRL